jgi:predicted SAM-dependent methyltransferase
MRVIVGAGNTQQPGWLPLQQSELDITDAAQWQRSFAPNSLDAILIEHVLEHLTPEGARRAARNSYRYLKRGGYLRVAVPDGFHPSPNYIAWTAPNSPGERFLQNFRAPQDLGHQVLWNYQTLSSLLHGAGFNVCLHEWFDERGQFYKSEWSAAHGAITRCANSSQSTFLSAVVNAPYTSLIVDAVKR